jgi:hypothetical protein
MFQSVRKRTEALRSMRDKVTSSTSNNSIFRHGRQAGLPDNHNKVVRFLVFGMSFMSIKTFIRGDENMGVFLDLSDKQG